ncbi:MAG TPA: FG-GAP-like repeat-containing protein, partial [Chakrabartia sp.]|nr:FG-GAP-like repeat-containing protein [Chakrabartia sp.]
NGLYWMSNGYQYGGINLRDMWNSPDGVTWTKVLDATPYPTYAQVIPFNGALYAISNETWRSDDGVNWIQATSETPFIHTAEMNVLVFNNKLWMLTEDGAWASDDGVNWARQSSFPFGARHHFSSMVFDGKLIVAGGFSDEANPQPETIYTDKTSHNDVWASSDGVTWERLTEHAEWSPRFFAPMQAYNGNLYLLGGLDNIDGANLGEVWVSADAIHWSLMDGARFSPRHWPGSLVVGDTLEVLGGNGWPTLNDIWSFSDAGRLPNYSFTAQHGFDLVLGSGNDIVRSGGGATHILAGAGDDTIYAAGGDKIIEGGAGNDILHAAAAESHPEQWVVGDFNGDGKDDVFRYIPEITGADVWLSNGSSFDRTGGWTSALHGAAQWYVGDFDGDGKDDIFRTIAGTSGADVWLSDGTRFVQDGSWTSDQHAGDPWHIGDFNGDGKDDIFRFVAETSKTEVYLSTGHSFEAAGAWADVSPGGEAWYEGDFNGDGLTDIFRYVPGTTGANVWLSDGTKFVDSGNWTPAGHGPERWYVADVNGDGKDDLFRYLPRVTGANVWLSDGTSFVDSGNWTPAGHGATTWLTGDFNGDSASDLARSFTLGGVLNPFISSGSTFDDNGLWSGGESSTFSFSPGFGQDQIVGFKTSTIDHDVLMFSGFGFSSVQDVLANATQNGADTIISFTDGSSIDLIGIQMAELAANQSIFIFG